MTDTATPIAIPQTPAWENLFGVCAALGEDFGFNPIWLRIAFGAGLVFQPIGVIAAYLGLGLIVLASRKLAPVPKPLAPPVAISASVARIAPPANAVADRTELPLAA